MTIDRRLIEDYFLTVVKEYLLPIEDFVPTNKQN